MELSYRYGDPATATAYPLDVDTQPIWRSVDGHQQASFHLPALPNAHIIVPSLAVLRDDFDYQCTLTIGEESVALERVPSGEPTVADAAKSASVSTHIDCFHTSKDIDASTVTIELNAEHAPARYLVTLTVRPIEVDSSIGAPAPTAIEQPPLLSQRQGPKAIRDRICSPTALAMALQHHQPTIDWLDVVDRCLDRVTNMYGSWPMAVHCAATYGRLAAVEVVTSWTPIVAALQAGTPVIASIRFAENALPGSPMKSTGGHLVVVYGVDGDVVLVNDPAADDADSVPRRYPLQAFADAWFRYRGAAYILTA